MCGIAGIILPSAQPGRCEREESDIRSMAGSLAHRGPDGEGYWTNRQNQVFFGHRRLAVIDLSPAAAQPMHAGGRYSIVYNGEIYNYPELRTSLQNKGIDFHTQSDTEVLLAAFACWGMDCLDKLDGMFAFAIWDEAQQTLSLARDRFGQKPLYYCRDANNRFLFASEMKAFWQAGFPKKAEAHAMLYFLATGQARSPLSPENSFYENIYQVPPAHYLQYQPAKDELTLSRYWDLDRTVVFSGSRNEAAVAVGKALEKSVQQSLRADLLCGSSLSGGIDSGSIAYEVSRSLGAGYHSFSAVFPGFEKDESALISGMAAYLGISNHQAAPDEYQLDRDFDRLLYQHEEPIGSAGVFAQYQVFKLAKETGVPVLLDGQGADELLGGYDTSVGWFLQSLWRSGRWRAFRQEKQAFRRHGWSAPYGYRNQVAALFPAAAQSALVRRERRQITGLPFVPEDRKAAFPLELVEKPLVTDLNDLLYEELTRSRLPELLRYADRNSMTFGCEVRLPFLNREIAELCFSLPAGYKLHQGFRKWALRASADKKLPQAIVWQKGKTGFEPPQAGWMQSARMRERLRAAREKLVADGFLEARVLETPARPAAAYHRDNYDWRQLVLASL
ncbi:MAG: asparagine synthase (glutamine-hydrolyzing) [Flavihumibacter sp.]